MSDKLRHPLLSKRLKEKTRVGYVDLNGAIYLDKDLLLSKEVLEQVLRLLEEDNHYYGDRACSTCRTITALVGRKFGCCKKN